MVNLPLSPAASANNHPSSSSGLPPRPRFANACCPGYRRQRPWTAERAAILASNVFVLFGTLTALIFAVVTVLQQRMEDYIILTVFIVGGTLFGGGCLVALINVSWLSRRPGVRMSAIQVICNVVLCLITSYLLLLFWPYPTVAYSILFSAGVPMFVMINLPSCFMKQHPDFQEGGTVCLDEDDVDDATIPEDLEVPKKHDDTQRTGSTVLDLETDMMDEPTVPFRREVVDDC